MGNLARRFGMDQPPQDPKTKLPDIPLFKASAPKIAAVVRLKSSLETKIGGETEIPVESVERGRGRPKTLNEPWKASGVSRAAWFRQKAAAKP